MATIEEIKAQLSGAGEEANAGTTPSSRMTTRRSSKSGTTVTRSRTWSQRTGRGIAR